MRIRELKTRSLTATAGALAVKNVAGVQVGQLTAGGLSALSKPDPRRLVAPYLPEEIVVRDFVVPTIASGAVGRVTVNFGVTGLSDYALVGFFTPTATADEIKACDYSAYHMSRVLKNPAVMAATDYAGTIWPGFGNTSNILLVRADHTLSQRFYEPSSQGERSGTGSGTAITSAANRYTYADLGGVALSGWYNSGTFYGFYNQTKLALRGIWLETVNDETLVQIDLLNGHSSALTGATLGKIALYGINT